MNRKKHGTYLVKRVVNSHAALHCVVLLRDRFHTQSSGAIFSMRLNDKRNHYLYYSE